MMLLVFDIGGTKIAAALVDCAGRVASRRSVATPRTGRADVLAAVVQLGRAMLEEGGQRVAAIGVATVGVVDREVGRIVAATDLLPGWRETEVAAELRDHFGLPVEVANDVNAWLLGERLAGNARGADVLFVAVGTGVGGAMLLNGRLWRGPTGWAGELAHLPDPTGGAEVCSCGSAGHLETVASGTALLRRHNQLGGRPCRALEEVATLAQAGDLTAAGVLASGAAALGRTVAGLTTAIGIPRVVVGGGVAESGETWWAPLRVAFHAALPPAFSVRLEASRLGGDAPLLGAAHLVADHVGWRMPALDPNGAADEAS